MILAPAEHRDRADGADALALDENDAFETGAPGTSMRRPPESHERRLRGLRSAAARERQGESRPHGVEG
jgi:hypothetical protein